MSKRAEQAASAAYPENGSDNWIARPFFQEGYEQAEKDLALTWEDIDRICDIEFHLRFEPDWCDCEDDEEYYGEVLRRFNESKK